MTKCSERGFSLVDNPSIAKQIINALFWMDSNERFTLGAFVIMPDHYHMVIILNESSSLDSVLKSLGSYTARNINRRFQKKGRLWQKGYYDRAIRKSDDIDGIFAYIHNNPVRKELTDTAETWPFSSLNKRYYKKINWELFT